MLALHQNKIHILKFSLLGSILSNLLLVLGTSLLFGGLSNLNKQQTFNPVSQKQKYFQIEHVRETRNKNINIIDHVFSTESRERKLFSVATRIAMPNAAIDIKICITIS